MGNRAKVAALVNIEGDAAGPLGLAIKSEDIKDHCADLATTYGALASIALSSSRTLGSLKRIACKGGTR